MEDVAREERTVLFVSHQMSTVKSLCSRAIQIHDGSLVQNGNPEAVTTHYLTDGSNGVIPEQIWESPETRPGNSQVRLIAIRVLNPADERQRVYGSSQPIVVEMEFEIFNVDRALFRGFDLINQNDILVFRSCHNHGHESEWPPLKLGLNKLQCIIPANMLNNGRYFVAPRIALQFTQWILFGKTEVGFEIQMDHWESPFWKASHVMSFPGVIAPCLSWRTLDVSSSEERLS